MRKVDKDLPKVLAAQHREVAKDVQQGSQTRLTRQPVPKRVGVVGRSGTARQASVVLKYSRYPWAAGAEFGSRRYKQFKPYRGADKGYLIQPTIEQKLPIIERSYVDAVEAAFRKHMAARGGL